MTVKTGEKPTSINDLKPKMKLTGVVKKVELFGAFVDVGVGQDGLLHISQRLDSDSSSDRPHRPPHRVPIPVMEPVALSLVSLNRRIPNAAPLLSTLL